MSRSIFVRRERWGLLSLEETKRHHVELVLAAVRWNMMHAAELLAIDRRSVYRMVERWQLKQRALTADDRPELERLGFWVEESPEGVLSAHYVSSDGSTSPSVVVGAEHASGGNP